MSETAHRNRTKLAKNIDNVHFGRMQPCSLCDSRCFLVHQMSNPHDVPEYLNANLLIPFAETRLRFDVILHSSDFTTALTDDLIPYFIDPRFNLGDRQNPVHDLQI